MQYTLWYFFTSKRVKVHIALTHSLPHSLAHTLFNLFIHGILIVSCLTLVKKVSKSLYENFDTNIGENNRSSK